MTGKINMKKGETNNYVSKSNTLRSSNTSISKNTCSFNIWSLNVSSI